MMKKFTALLLGAMISLQCVLPFGFTSTAESNTNISAERVIQLEYDESAEPVEIEVYEGEQIQLDFQLDSELYDTEDVRYYSRKKCAVVSPTGKFVGCKSGEDKVDIGVTDKTTGDQLIYTLLVNVLPNNSISDKKRNELNRLNDFEYDDYRRRKMELLGAADENAPRLTFEKIQEFIDNSENYIDIIKKVNNYIEYPDHVQSKGHESYSYWSDSRGNEVISIGYDSDYICYGKIADDGTVIGSQMLYPEKTEFIENGKDKSYEYIEYNQIKYEADSDIRVINIEDLDEDSPAIELYEGEQVQLDFQLDPEIYDLEDIRSYEENRKPIVSYDGKLIGCNSGKYDIIVFVRNMYTYDSIKFKLVVNVLPNENISSENRAKLDRINNFGLHDYRRRKMELLGAMDENAPRLTLDKIQEFIDNSEDFYEIIRQVNKYVDYPDDVSGSGMIKHYYWSDPKGNESISISSDNEYIGYVKTAYDGTVIGSQMLYPEKTEFEEDGKSKNSPYIEYNQIESGPDRVIQLEYDESAEPVEIELYEGEQVQLIITDEPDMPEISYVAFHASNQIATISHDLKLTGICAGEEHITVFIERKDIPYEYWQDLRLHILKNDSISAENRAELERLNQLDGFYRRKMELVGALDEDAPRLDMEKVQEIIDTSEDYTEILMRFNQYHSYADIQPAGGGFTTYNYWFDPNGNESICYILEQEFIAYTKIADDGTVIGVQQLYPEKTEFIENGKDKSYEYIEYNQIKPKLEGYGTLNLKFIDESTDEPFTETNGIFQLIYNNDKGDIEIVKSWDSSEGSEITISDLSRDYTYELRYIDNYHGEFPEEYKYEISLEKGKRFFSFSDDRELSCDVYLKKHILGEPYLLGDVNRDKALNVADVVTLQKWLLCKPNTVLMNWRAADLCKDDRIDVFDLCIMKEKILTR